MLLVKKHLGNLRDLQQLLADADPASGIRVSVCGRGEDAEDIDLEFGCEYEQVLKALIAAEEEALHVAAAGVKHDLKIAESELIDYEAWKAKGKHG